MCWHSRWLSSINKSPALTRYDRIALFSGVSSVLMAIRGVVTRIIQLRGYAGLSY